MASVVAAHPGSATGPVVRDASMYAAAQYAATALGFAKTAIAAQWLGPAGYGASALLMVYPDLLWSTAGVKSADITTRYLARFGTGGQEKETAAVARFGFSIDMAVSILAAALVAASGGWAARHFVPVENAWPAMTLYAVLFVPASLGGTSQAILSVAGRFGLLAAWQVASATIQFLLALAALSLGLGLHGLVIAVGVGQAINGAVLTVAARRIHSSTGVGSWLGADFKSIEGWKGELRSMIGWNYLFLTVRSAFEQIPALILGSACGVAATGYFRLASSIATVCSYPENALGRVIYPKISSAVFGRAELRRKLRSWSLRLGLPFAAAILAGMFLIEGLVPRLFGPAYRPLVPGLIAMLAGVALSTALFWVNPLYYATARVGCWTRVYSVLALGVLALSLPVASYAGFTGIAVLVAGAKALFVLAMVWINENSYC